MTGNNAVAQAPEIAVSRWFNTDEPLTLAGLRGRPVLLHAFQMLCPGCVAHGTPQTQRAFDLFKHSDLQVIGLHTVFEHHAAMTPLSLEAFIHEYRLTFPIGVDEAAEGVAIPGTMDSGSRTTWRSAPSSRHSWPRRADDPDCTGLLFSSKTLRRISKHRSFPAWHVVDCHEWRIAM